MVEFIAQDIRYAARTLFKSPSFTLTCVGVLALAIGANTAMFSVMDAVLFRPLPYRSPEQLAMLWTEIPSQNVREGRSANWNFEQWRSQSRTFVDMAAFDPASVTLINADKAEPVSVVRTTPNLFSLLGVQPALGRVFSPMEADQRQRVAVISDAFWRTRLGASQDVIGKTIVLDGIPSEIVGILPLDFQFLQGTADVWEPHTLLPDFEAAAALRGVGTWFVIGRLQPKVGLAQAQGEMNSIAQHLDDQVSQTERQRGISIVPLTVQLMGSRTRLALWMLWGAVFCVLLIAASNVASLTLARGAGREGEMAIRAALGASRSRIVRQLLAESVTLAVLSGLLGLFVAHAGVLLILALRPNNVARLSEISIDPRALAWTSAICLVTGILVGLAPATTTVRRNLKPTGEKGRVLSSGVAVRGMRRVLVVTEFALAIMLSVGAGLLIRSLFTIENVDPGFRPERVLSVQLAVPPLMASARRADFYNRVLEATESIGGVESAGIIGDLFIGGNPERIVSVEGATQIASERVRLRVDEVSTEFFKTAGTPLIRGRFFSRDDGPESPRVAIINDAIARRLWPGVDPLNRRFKFGGADSVSPWFTVVGVVAGMRRQGLENEPIPQIFEPLAQNPSRLATLLVRTSVNDPLKMAGTVEAAVRHVDKYASFYGVTTLENRLGGFLTERRFQTSLLITFSIVALLMAALGIYGLIQYSIAMRTQEIGIRIAIGAEAVDIFRMILREGVTLTIIGAVPGLLGAIVLGRLISSLLYGVSGTDLLTFTSVLLLLSAVAMCACYFPARRAMKVDPIVALHHE